MAAAGLIEEFFQINKGASLVTQLVKNPPAMRETWVQFLGWEDPLEKGMATHYSFLACRIPMDRGSWRATINGFGESDRTERVSTPQVILLIFINIKHMA